MKSIEAIKKIYFDSRNLSKKKFPSNEGEEKIDASIEQMKNLFFLPILNFLFAQNYEALSKIKERAKPKGPLFNLANFAAALCEKESDFDFLTLSENLLFYKKLSEYAEKFQKNIPRYIKILERICDNKSIFVYKEFQEVEFFFLEVEKSQNDFEKAFNECRRVLRLQTQKIFSEFISLNFFEAAKKILFENEKKIYDITVLKFFVFSKFFFDLHLSNKNENLLFCHIEFCLLHLEKTAQINFKKFEHEKKFSQYDLDGRLEMFFKNANCKKENLPALLLDYGLGDEEINLFCKDLRNLFCKKEVLFNLGKNKGQIETLCFLNAEKNENALFLLSVFFASGMKINLKKIEPSFEIFKKFFCDDFIQNAKDLLLKKPIENKTELVFFIYGRLYYKFHFSNKNEKILFSHMNYFLDFIWEKEFQNRNLEKRQKYFLGVDLKLRLEHLFEHENVTEKNLIAFLRDYGCGDEGMNKFCDNLKNFFLGKNVEIKNSNAVFVLKKVLKEKKFSNETANFLNAFFIAQKFGFVNMEKMGELGKLFKGNYVIGIRKGKTAVLFPSAHFAANFCHLPEGEVDSLIETGGESKTGWSFDLAL